MPGTGGTDGAADTTEDITLAGIGIGGLPAARSTIPGITTIPGTTTHTADISDTRTGLTGIRTRTYSLEASGRLLRVNCASVTEWLFPKL